LSSRAETSAAVVRPCVSAIDEGEAGKNYRDPAVRKGPRTRLYCVCLCISRWYHYPGCW